MLLLYSIEDAQKLSNNELARVLINRLLNVVEISAISIGLNIRSDFLESITKLFPKTDVFFSEWSPETSDLIKEAKSREPEKRVHSLLPNNQSRFSFDMMFYYLSDDAIICLLLFELIKWYEDNKDLRLKSLDFEREIMLAILNLLFDFEYQNSLIAHGLPYKDYLDIIKEANYRYKDHLSDIPLLFK